MNVRMTAAAPGGVGSRFGGGHLDFLAEPEAVFKGDSEGTALRDLGEREHPGDEFDISSLPPEIREKLDGYDRYAPVLHQLGQEGIHDAAGFEQRIMEYFQRAQEEDELNQLRVEMLKPYWDRVESGELTEEEATAQYYQDLEQLEALHHYQMQLADLQHQQMAAELDHATSDFPLFHAACSHKDVGPDAKELALFLAAQNDVPVVEAVAYLNKLIEPVVRAQVAEGLTRHVRNGRAQTPLPSGNTVIVGASSRGARRSPFDILLERSRR